MAVLPTRSKSAIVATIAAGMQSRAGILITFVVGSVFLALAEGYAGVSLWQQGMALQIVQLTRLATSFGGDVDSWLADFQLITRIGSTAATGLVTFSRYTASGSAPTIAVGATVRTSDGKQTFAVYADSTNPIYDPARQVYVLQPQVLSVSVPVRCVTPSPNGTVQPDGTIGSGVNGNVAAGSITQLASQIVGIDTVTNPAAFTNGSDQESDSQVKARFPQAMSALSKGTVPAIMTAIGAVQTGLQIQVRDNANLDGSVNPGMVSVIVDDGSGSLSDTLLALCRAAATSVKAGGVRIGVFAASRVMVQVQLVLYLKTGYTRQNVAPLVSAAIANGINGLGLGGEVDLYTVGAWALGVAGVQKIDGLLLNGSNLDIAPDPRYTPKCSGVVVN